VSFVPDDELKVETPVAQAVAETAASKTVAAAPTGADGWKLHLNPVPGSEQAISDYLTEQGIPHKVGQNSGQTGKGITVYAGARDTANAVAKDINSRFDASLKDAEGDVLTDDTPIAGKVWGVSMHLTTPNFINMGRLVFRFLPKIWGSLNMLRIAA